MKFRVTTAICTTFLATTLSAVASAADPQLLRLMMPDAKVVSGIDVDRVKAAPFGQFFLSQIPIDSGFDQMVSLTGFDPRRDVHEVVMASPGDAARKSGMVIVRGTFDPARILTLVQSGGHTAETYKGVAIFAPGKGDAMHGVAFLDSSIVVAGDLESVRGAIDRRAGAGGVTAELLTRIAGVSSNQDAWMVSLVPVSAFAAAAPNRNVQGALNGDLLKSIEQSSGGVRFGNVIEISGELTARTAQDASSLADVVKFLLSMAQTQAPAGQPAQFAALLKNMTVMAQSNAVKLSLGIPEIEVESLVKLNSGRRRTKI